MDYRPCLSLLLVLLALVPAAAAAPPGGTGAYRLPSGDVLGVFGLGGPQAGVDFATGEVHGLFASSRGYDVGQGILERGTPLGTTALGADPSWLGSPLTRLPVRYVDVKIGVLAGTLWLPAGGGRHAAVAIIHGSGLTTRDYAGALPSFFAAHGLVVLAFDKRGVGKSGGFYPGERATSRAIDVLARDAAAAARFLAHRPDVDQRRVGLAGQSQAGWVMARAAALDPTIRWLIAYSGPSVSVGESDMWGQLAGQGGPPAEPLAQARRDVSRAGRSGFDPMPSLRKTAIPMLFLYGGNDRHVPTWLCVQRLAPLRPRVEVDWFPRGDHFLIDTDHGLTSELQGSSHYAKGVWASIDSWLTRHRLAA